VWQAAASRGAEATPENNYLLLYLAVFVIMGCKLKRRVMINQIDNENTIDDSSDNERDCYET
jgi:hypothetical protein